MVFTKDILQRVKELNPEVYIRSAKKDDAEIFVLFFNSYYRRKTSKEYFFWQFFESYYLSELFMAFSGEDLIGCYGVKLYPLTNNSFSCFSIDFLIDDAHRKRGIAYLLYEKVINFCSENGASCLTSLPNANGNASFKSFGSESLVKVDTLVLNLDTKKNNFIEVPKSTKCTINYIEFKKDENYRKWRFDLNPLYNYKKNVIDDNCFAYTKMFRDPNTDQLFYDIVDFHFDTLENAYSLIELIISGIEEKESSKLTIWALPHTELYILLVNVGFLISENERYFCLKIFSTEYEYLSDIKIWNISEADAEIY